MATITAADVLSTVQAAVEAHVTHNTFYSIWNVAKDRPSELDYPCAIWLQWPAQHPKDARGVRMHHQVCGLLVVTSVDSDRTAAERDAAVNESHRSALDIVQKIEETMEVDNVSGSTVFDEFTAFETGFLIRFTVIGDAACIDETRFPPDV